MIGTRSAIMAVILFCFLIACPLPASGDDVYAGMRRKMIEQDIKGQGIKDPAVLGAMSRLPRHLFVSAAYRHQAYADHPLPIGEGQTISQPYVVALMTEILKLRPADRVLEIGTGSGYQAAVLSEIVKEVCTIEIRRRLAEQAEKTFAGLGISNVRVKYGDGYFGWPERAPFDAIIITAAANHIPPPLLAQLKEGGRLVVPLGTTVYFQTLTLVTKRRGELDVQQISPVAFVPMTGKMQEQ